MKGRILKDERQRTGWVIAVFDGHYLEAKVYDEGSRYGINGGRVSKLSVLNRATHERGGNWWQHCCYNYDRGLDFDKAPAGLIDEIVKWLESLPTVRERVI